MTDEISADAPHNAAQPDAILESRDMPPLNNDAFVTVTLSEPIRRGDTAMSSITLRRPNAGELRGLSLQGVLTSDVSAMLTLLPRITQPPLTDDEVANLHPADFVEMAGAARGFFMTAAEKAAMQAMMADAGVKVASTT